MSSYKNTEMLSIINHLNHKHDYCEYYFYKRPHLIPVEPTLEFFYFPWSLYALYMYSHIKINGEYPEQFTIDNDVVIYDDWKINLYKKLNIKRVYASNVEVGKTHKNGIEFIPFQYFIPDEIECYPEEKIYEYSFVGTLSTHHSRKLMYLKYKNKDNCKMIIRDRYHFDREIYDNNQQKNSKEYHSILRKTKYALCPRGLGIGSIRYFEAIKCGCIPIEFDSNWMKPI